MYRATKLLQRRGKITPRSDPITVTPPPTPDEIERTFQAKRECHESQAKLPLQEKGRILHKMQRNAYPILKARGMLKEWQKPWDVEPWMPTTRIRYGKGTAEVEELRGMLPRVEGGTEW